MRLSSGFFVLVVALLSTFCTSRKKEPISTDVEMKQILAESMPGCSYDSLTCAQFDVSYPEFKGLDSIVRLKIKNLITHNLSNGVEGEEKSLDVQAKEFVDEYKQFKAETPDMFGRWYRSIAIEVMIFNDSLLSMQISDESFEGGAHGNYALTFVNVRPATGNVFTLTDFLKPGYQEELTRIGEEIFRHEREMADSASYEMSGFTFDNNKFALNDNYGFRKEGIAFYYNSYEVAPYSEGPTEVLIPYDRIKDWIKSDLIQQPLAFAAGR